ncbi:hypothetical protein PHLCEN_2v12885 [Hermanssonia centrifuga]|uniref:Uncharacterized protein n=1 Tax=Hermanssonia centrifuga TaxID=98765 RepID=A0A2R6NFY2_9APHY|nr:hypothetical protein PHLCEN_2v12885 [Hermanssonia centrifuga]
MSGDKTRALFGAKSGAAAEKGIGLYAPIKRGLCWSLFPSERCDPESLYK